MTVGVRQIVKKTPCIVEHIVFSVVCTRWDKANKARPPDPVIRNSDSELKRLSSTSRLPNNFRHSVSHQCPSLAVPRRTSRHGSLHGEDAESIQESSWSNWKRVAQLPAAESKLWSARCRRLKPLVISPPLAEHVCASCRPVC